MARREESSAITGRTKRSDAASAICVVKREARVTIEEYHVIFVFDGADENHGASRSPRSTGSIPGNLVVCQRIYRI